MYDGFAFAAGTAAGGARMSVTTRAMKSIVVGLACVAAACASASSGGGGGGGGDGGTSGADGDVIQLPVDANPLAPDAKKIHPDAAAPPGMPCTLAPQTGCAAGLACDLDSSML